MNSENPALHYIDKQTYKKQWHSESLRARAKGETFNLPLTQDELN